MEPNTSSSPAAWTSSPAAVVLEHGEPSVRDPSLLSPAFSPAPGSGSEWSWYQQIPPSPAVAAAGNGNGSVSVDAHATSPPSSSFHTAGTLPPVGYDLFGDLEATAAATPLPTFLGDQWEQRESSSMAASVLPEFPSPGLFEFAGESPVWPCEEMPSPYFSPSFSGDLAPQSIDNLDGFAKITIDDEEEEEEEIDVSAYLVSDPEEELPDASWTADPQMAGTGGGGASWMAPAGSTGNNSWPPPMLAPAAASTCTMVSTSSGSMACHSGGASIGVGVASSTGGTMTPSSPVLPLVPPPPSTQGAGASSNNFNGFAQPNLQGPLLPVKEEVMDYVVDAAARRHPDFISLDDDDDEDSYNGFGSWGNSSSPASIAPGSWLGRSSGSPSFAPGSWGGGSSSSSRSFAPGNWGSSSGSPSFATGSWSGGSSSSSPSFATGSWGGGCCSSSSPSFATRSWGSSSDSPSFAHSSWGGGGSSSSPSFAHSSWGGGSSSPSFGTGSWGSSSSSPNFAGSMLCFNGSTSIDNYLSSSMRELSIRGKMQSTPGRPPLPRAGASSRSNRGAGVVFTDPEKAIIAKDKKLQELLRTDPKKVKRLLYNRSYAAMAKARKEMRTKDLERLVVTLEARRKSLCAELQSLEEGSAALMAQKTKMQMIIGELEQQTMLKDVIREGLKAEIQNLKHLKLN